MSAPATKPRGYFGKIAVAARTVGEGMAVTLAQYFRRPTTVQYPDRTRVPVVESLPERYRGFLEVDMSICTACKACERDCPIDVIAIDVEKRGAERVMTRFDIDMGKCMYCGICVESCPVPAQAPGDAEATKCIRMTREFEGATSELPSLTFRFVEPGAPAPAYKHSKGSVPATPVRGQIARAVRQRARGDNGLAFRWALAQQRGGALAAVVAVDVVSARADALAARVAAIRAEATSAEAKRTEAARAEAARAEATRTDDATFASLVVDEALAKTDCGKCGHASCHAYAGAIAGGRERALGKCEPGGARATRDLNLLVQLRRGAAPADAARHALAATLRRHT